MTFSRITGVQGTPANIPTGIPAPAPSGGGGIEIIAFPFTYATASLDGGQGVVVYTPTVGDLLYDAWFSIATPWNGTTPHGDIGTWTNLPTSPQGLFHEMAGVAPDMTSQDGTKIAFRGTTTSHTGLTYPANASLAQVSTAAVIATSGGGFAPGDNVPPALFTTTDPLRLCVSSPNGWANGASPGASQGVATLYLAIGKPS